MSEKKTKTQFSAVDAGIIAVIILCVCFVFYKFGIVDKIRSLSESCDATIVFIAEKVPEESENMFPAGGTVYYGDKFFGNITDSFSEKSVIFKESTDGKYVSAESDVLTDITVTVESVIYENSKGYMLNGEYIAPGSELTIRCGNSETKIIVLAVTVISGE